MDVDRRAGEEGGLFLLRPLAAGQIVVVGVDVFGVVGATEHHMKIMIVALDVGDVVGHRRIPREVVTDAPVVVLDAAEDAVGGPLGVALQVLGDRLRGVPPLPHDVGQVPAHHAVHDVGIFAEGRGQG